MGALVALPLVALGVFTLLLLRHYRHPSTPAWALACVFLAWYACFAASVLLPVDIAATQTADSDSRALASAWDAMYWVTFALSWGVLPLQMEFWASGFFSTRERLAHSLRVNLRFYVGMLCALLVFSLYVGVAQHLSLEGLLGFLMAAGNTWGLLLIVMLMGYGLVSVPRRLWQMGSPRDELKRLEYRATQIEAELHEAEFALGEVLQELISKRRLVGALFRARPGDNEALHACLETVMATVRELGSAEDLALVHGADAGLAPEPHKSGGSSSSSSASPPPPPSSSSSSSSITTAQMAALHTRLRAALAVKARYEHLWHSLLDKALALQALAAEAPPAEWRPLLGWQWRHRARPLGCRVLAVLCGAMSALVVWSEVMLATPVDLSAYGALVDAVGAHHPGAVFSLSLLPLAYMSVCCYRSLFKLKLAGSFALHVHHSDAYSLLFNAAYLCRLQFPLCYNFLQALRYEAAADTAFTELMTGMNVVPLLGAEFGVYAPLLLVLLAGVSLFNGYSRLLRAMGVEHLEAPTLGNPDDEERMEEGRGLVRRGLARRERARARARSSSSAPSSSSASSSSSSSSSASSSFSASLPPRASDGALVALLPL